MKKYYYVCPRCGRTWVRYIPRSKMKCKFCEETWHTKNRKGTRSRFSFTATFLWIFWIVLIIWGAVKVLGLDVKPLFDAKPSNSYIRLDDPVEEKAPSAEAEAAAEAVESLTESEKEAVSAQE
ncbi:MAG: hypothetical protein II561_10385 [Thermoguttaceae bacterium]|nr:hypothetical protein [Thermoguttaceae bacterium]MBQ1863116.1 hypothetical protein [Thermoguttaceae bacterium]MBQ2039924.1 hypothetical protein [Thermoguttaceae bacterium]MBQ2556945.1 hypothetical protein [Thermoguttaceae bacterium]MBQ3823375.1 hypothetical protein [Thermoguttaceae bacterium]